MPKQLLLPYDRGWLWEYWSSEQDQAQLQESPPQSQRFDATPPYHRPKPPEQLGLPFEGMIYADPNVLSWSLQKELRRLQPVYGGVREPLDMHIGPNPLPPGFGKQRIGHV